MSQKERDHLKVLHEAGNGRITQAQAAGQLGLSERQVRRLLEKVRAAGDRGVIHGLRGRASNRRIDPQQQERAVKELSRPECRDFGPTFAAEHVGRKLAIHVGRDTMRKWMTGAGLWRPRARRIKAVHQWRQRRACFGELVQWDTSVHDWLEGRGERLYLIAMIDDATSRVLARFVRCDDTEQNMRLLWAWLNSYGRPLAFYTDKASMFEVNARRADADNDHGSAATQITRALAELGIERISAHSPQAKGRIERFFQTAQDRLVKQLRLSGACTLEAANVCLRDIFLPEWQQRFTVPPANDTDAHRPLTELHDVAASLSEVETRTVASDYTLPFRGQRYQIARGSVRTGMKGEKVRVEARLDGTIAARWQGRYLDISPVTTPPAVTPPSQSRSPVRKDHNRGGRSRWMKDYPLSSVKLLRNDIRQPDGGID